MTKRAMATATRVVGDEESTGNRNAVVTAMRVVGVKEGLRLTYSQFYGRRHLRYVGRLRYIR